jgi:hypothetical protein
LKFFQFQKRRKKIVANLRNILVGAGLAIVGGIGTKVAMDYLRNRGEEEVKDASGGDAQAANADEVAYATVEPASVQDFLDKSFGNPGRYVANRPPKVFEYQGENYMVIWAKDHEKQKNQMLAFIYNETGRDMIASVGYTSGATDYDINLAQTPFAIEVNDQKFTDGKGETSGANDVDFVLK